MTKISITAVALSAEAMVNRTVSLDDRRALRARAVLVRWLETGNESLNRVIRCRNYLRSMV